MRSHLAFAQAAAAPAVTGGVFTFPVIINPALWPLIGGVQKVMVNRVLFNNLTTYGDPGQKVVVDLAESWTVDKDKLSRTFNLRKNMNVRLQAFLDFQGKLWISRKHFTGAAYSDFIDSGLVAKNEQKMIFFCTKFWTRMTVVLADFKVV